MFFLGVSKDGQTIYEINNAKLASKVDSDNSGQKLSTQNWLSLYLRKPLMNKSTLAEHTRMVKLQKAHKKSDEQ